VARPAVAEALWTAFLLAAVVGSGIMGERLAGGNVVVALLANTLATGAMLVALILTFGPVSGAHFNPAVTPADASQGGLPWRDVAFYIAAQISGDGVAAAHLMLEPVFFASRHVRAGNAQLFSEFVATFGLLLDHFGLRSAPLFSGAVCRGRLYHWSLLVHVLDLVCQSCRNAGPRRVRHVRGHPSGRCSGIHRRAARRGDRCNAALPVASAVTSEGCF
jgi:glycerol uptake facilitator-like aquaporin